MALRRQMIPVDLGGGLDTKTSPVLVQPGRAAQPGLAGNAGGFIELENVFRQRTGEFVKRFGSTSISGTAFDNTGGALLGRLRGALVSVRSAVSGVNNGKLLWQLDPSLASSPWSFPPQNFRGSTVTPVLGQALYTAIDSPDPDSATVGNYSVIGNQFVDGSAVNTVTITVTDNASGLPVGPPSYFQPAERLRCAAVTGFICSFYVDTTANSLIAKVFNTTTTATATFTVAAGVLPAANRFYDVRPRDGGTTIIIAYRVAAGGVSFVEFNPSTGALTTGPVNIAGVDANQCLGWLEDRFATGSYYLASAGTTSGVVVRTLSTAFAATATNTMDATATANVRNVTGFLTSAGAQMKTFWEVSAAATINSLVRFATWTGASAVAVFRRSVGLASKAFAYRNGYYLCLSYESLTQPTSFVAFTEPTTAGVPCEETPILYGVAGGHTANACALPAVYVVAGVANLATALRIKIQAANGAFSQVRAAAALQLRFDERAVGSPRELGGSLFIPGGTLKIFDGQVLTDARPPLGAEAVTPTNTGAGNLTATATYNWSAVYKYVDASGRIYRSSPSVLAPLTGGGANFAASVSVPTLRLGSKGGILGFSPATVELYRTLANGTALYKVIETPNNQSVDTVTIADNVADATLALNELAYTSGSVLDDFDAAAFVAIEVFGGRLWGISSEDRTRIFYSKELLPGLGVAFRPDTFVRLDQADGDVFALGILDDKLLFFKRSTIYSLAGPGPNAIGQGGYDTPVLITNAQGSINARSVVVTPDGVMFEAQRGIWMLDRGGQLSYIGAGVDAYFTGGGLDISAAVHVPWRTQVRFFTTGGRTLVYDYQQRQWSTFTGQPASGAVTIGTTLYWCHPTTDVVSQEVEGTYGDNGVGYAQKITTPHLAFAGISGFQHVDACALVGELVGTHTLSIAVELNYAGAPAFTRTGAGATVWPRPVMRFDVRRCEAAKLTIAESAANVNGGFKLSALSLQVAVMPGLSRRPATNRLT